VPFPVERRGCLVHIATNQKNSKFCVTSKTYFEIWRFLSANQSANQLTWLPLHHRFLNDMTLLCHGIWFQRTNLTWQLEGVTNYMIDGFFLLWKKFNLKTRWSIIKLSVLWSSGFATRTPQSTPLTPSSYSRPDLSSTHFFSAISYTFWKSALSSLSTFLPLAILLHNFVLKVRNSKTVSKVFHWTCEHAWS
jgi:hypothetical protein